MRPKRLQRHSTNLTNAMKKFLPLGVTRISRREGPYLPHQRGLVGTKAMRLHGQFLQRMKAKCVPRVPCAVTANRKWLAPTWRIMLEGILWHQVPIVASKSKTVGVGSHPSLNLHHVCPFTRAPCPIRFRFFPFAFASFATSPFALLGCRGPCDGVRMRTMQELCGSPSTACARKQSLLSTSRPCRPAHKRLILVDALFDTTAFFAF